jgi:hypothetical protein
MADTTFVTGTVIASSWLNDVNDTVYSTVSAENYSTLQEALDTGKVVILKEGKTYPVTSQLTIPSGSGIIGRGTLTFNSTNFTSTTNTVSTSSVVLYALSADKVILRDFKMQGTCAANSYLFPIALRDVEKAYISNVEITGLNAGAAIKIDSCFDVVITENNFHTCEINRTGSTAQLTAISVDDHRVSNVGSERIIITDNTAKNLTVTAGFLATYGYQTDFVNFAVGGKYNVIANNSVDTVGEGVDLFCDESIVMGNNIANAYGVGVKLVHGASRNLVTGNRITNPGLGGIMVAGSSTASQNTDDNLVTGNFISGVNASGAWTADTTYAVACNNDGTYKATNTLISNNHCVNSTGADCNILLGGSGTGNRAIFNTSDSTPTVDISGTNGTGATYLKRGGISNANRFEEVNDSGQQTIRYDDNGTPIARSLKNFGITASTQGIQDVVYFGTGGVQGDVASAWKTITTADWSNAANRSAKMVLQLALAGSTTDVATFDPSSGLTLAGAMNANSGQFGGVVTATRYTAFDSSGKPTFRRDAAAGATFKDNINYGITAANQGLEETWSFGTGGSLVAVAARSCIYAADTFANAGTADAKYLFKLAVNGSEVTVLTIDPSAATPVYDVTNVHFRVATAGYGLRVAEGSNCKQGTATLVGGTVTVSNTSVTANSRIFLTSQADGGTPGFLRVSARVAGTSFTITSSSGTDTSTVAYQIFEPA